MRLAASAVGLVLMAAPAFAQQVTPARPAPEAGRTPGPPLDRGPSTPEANAAHRGGGVVLEGAPGAPAPPPMPTPPRDTPPASAAPAVPFR